MFYDHAWTRVLHNVTQHVACTVLPISLCEMAGFSINKIIDENNKVFLFNKMPMSNELSPKYRVTLMISILTIRINGLETVRQWRTNC